MRPYLDTGNRSQHSLSSPSLSKGANAPFSNKSGIREGICALPESQGSGLRNFG